MKLLLASAFSFLAVSPALAVDPTGVPPCDALLQRYETCSSLLPKERLHAAQQELLDGASGIRANAADPKLRAELERYCVDTFARMKTESEIKECMAK